MAVGGDWRARGEGRGALTIQKPNHCVVTSSSSAACARATAAAPSNARRTAVHLAGESDSPSRQIEKTYAKMHCAASEGEREGGGVARGRADERAGCVRERGRDEGQVESDGSEKGGRDRGRRGMPGTCVWYSTALADVDVSGTEIM